MIGSQYESVGFQNLSWNKKIPKVLMTVYIHDRKEYQKCRQSRSQMRRVEMLSCGGVNRSRNKEYYPSTRLPYPQYFFW